MGSGNHDKRRARWREELGAAMAGLGDRIGRISPSRPAPRPARRRGARCACRRPAPDRRRVGQERPADGGGRPQERRPIARSRHLRDREDAGGDPRSHGRIAGDTEGSSHSASRSTARAHAGTRSRSPSTTGRASTRASRCASSAERMSTRRSSSSAATSVSCPRRRGKSGRSGWSATTPSPTLTSRGSR